MKTYMTIDFEDFSHDLGRRLQLKPNLSSRIDALYTSYSEINSLVTRHSSQENPGATFFITGVLADQAPELIRQIARDGHEIGCHYYYHDEMRIQNVKNIEYMLKKAIDSLEKSSNQKVNGFRAPYFKIDKSGIEQYKVIEKLFKYDSSLCVNSQEALSAFYKRMNLKTLKLIPVFSDKVFCVPMKTGGTFAKVFPTKFFDRILEKNTHAKLNRILYFHPYEFKNGTDWQLSFQDLANLGIHKKLFWFARQKQWLHVGNRSLGDKISKVMKDATFAGHLNNLI